MNAIEPVGAAEPQGTALLLSLTDLARLLAVSVVTARRMKAGGQLPRHVLVRESKRWVRAEVEAWIGAGCPEQRKWEVIWKARRR
jgi:predicted DNA-binding transcriptional regulator AlpA